MAEKALPELAKIGGFDVTIQSDGRDAVGRPSPEEVAKMDFSFLTPSYLAQFDGLLMFTNGNLPLPPSRSGASSTSCATARPSSACTAPRSTMYDYAEYGDLMGAYYLRSIISTDQNPRRFAVLKVEDETHPATPTENVSAVGQLPIPLAFSRDRVKVLLSIDTDKTDLKDLPLTKGGDYPQSWYRTFGKGRSFYTALGTSRRAGATPSSARTSLAASAGRSGSIEPEAPAGQLLVRTRPARQPGTGAGIHRLRAGSARGRTEALVAARVGKVGSRW